MTRKTWAGAALLTAFATLTAPALAQRGPAPALTGLPSDVLALICAPRVMFELPDRSLRVTGGQDSIHRRQWGPGDLLTINAGTQNGIEVGQEYFIRRIQMDDYSGVSRETPGSVRTAGWLRVYAVDDEMSLATVTYACDSVEVGDYLEPFVMPVPPKVSTTTAKPQRDNYGQILFGLDYRRSFAKGDFFIVNRGTDHGVMPGDRFVVYRDKKNVTENFLYDLGEAVAVLVSPETSTLRVTVSRDAFTSGDLVAIRK